MNLGQILTKYGSDKESGHSYGATYERIFSLLPENLKILEIGIDNGFSLQAWREYRPQATIYGVDRFLGFRDVFHDRKKLWRWCKLFLKGEHIILRDIQKVKNLPLFDLIIDDGSHKLFDMAYTAECLMKNLTPKGIMVIEDIRYQEFIPALKKVILHRLKHPEYILFEEIRTELNGLDSLLLVVHKNK